MNQKEVKKFLESFIPKRERTIVIVDFGNVEKWKNSLKWQVGIKELAQLVKNQKTVLADGSRSKSGKPYTYILKLTNLHSLSSGKLHPLKKRKSRFWRDRVISRLLPTFSL